MGFGLQIFHDTLGAALAAPERAFGQLLNGDNLTTERTCFSEQREGEIRQIPEKEQKGIV